MSELILDIATLIALVVCAGALVTIVRRFAEMDVDNAKKMQATYEAIDSLKTPLEALVALEQGKQERRQRAGQALIQERLKIHAERQAAKAG